MKASYTFKACTAIALAWSALAAASSATAQAPFLFGDAGAGAMKPVGLLKGTFDPDVAAKVDAENARAHTLNKRTGNDSVTTNGWGTFDQLLDHTNASAGTFRQRYWYSTTYWKGPGSPVIMTNPGEQSGTGWNATYLTNQRIIGRFAEAVGGAVVILEHRYYGESSPFADLTVQNLTYLTLDNALRDATYFASTFVPPFDPSGASHPTTAPWVLTGGSYSGALAAWTASRAALSSSSSDASPFWAYYASSGVVQAIGDFWEYFAMAQTYTPQNCSSDLSATMAHIDSVLVNGSSAAKAALKNKFLLGDLEDADFVRALAYGPIFFQQTQFYFESTYGYAPYTRFCDYIENVWPGSNNTVPDKRGVGVSKALDGYAKWVIEYILTNLCESYGYSDYQGTYNTGCLQNLNASTAMYRDISPSNLVSRQYWWLVCNEPLVWFQDGLPAGQPSIVSRLVSYDYHLAICKVLFPESEGGFGLVHGRRPADVNAHTGGWSVPANMTPRLLYANGQIDPWRAATVSSDWRPGGPMASSDNVPINVVPGGGHCSDVYAENWNVNAEVKAIVDKELDIMLGWINDFYSTKGLTKPE